MAVSDDGGIGNDTHWPRRWVSGSAQVSQGQVNAAKQFTNAEIYWLSLVGLI